MYKYNYNWKLIPAQTLQVYEGSVAIYNIQYILWFENFGCVLLNNNDTLFTKINVKYNIIIMRLWNVIYLYYNISINYINYTIILYYCIV